jgi:hypothetical protein
VVKTPDKQINNAGARHKIETWGEESSKGIQLFKFYSTLQGNISPTIIQQWILCYISIQVINIFLAQIWVVVRF